MLSLNLVADRKRLRAYLDELSREMLSAQLLAQAGQFVADDDIMAGHQHHKPLVEKNLETADPADSYRKYTIDLAIC